MIISLDSESKKISYFSDKSFGNYNYGPNHLMKPHRVKITDSLVKSYNLLDKMNLINPDYYEDIVKSIDFTKFHSDEYIDFLETVTPENTQYLTEQLMYFNINEDCPIFDNIYDFCKIYTTGSILGAHLLNTNVSKIAINWSGGLHHAKKHQASGFCYVNDCVLAILELLKYNERVLYIDIDIHHGDGVEEAFYTTDRVLTLSFHKYGDYFPGTGGLYDTGYGKGVKHSVNVPYHEGMDDIHYENMFKLIFDEVCDKFRPNAIVLQCGADSLSGDRLGCFNLSVKGHAACVEYVKSKHIPVLAIGGGGYTLRNVPRCWTYETAVLLGQNIPDDIPANSPYADYFYPEYKLHIPVSNMENVNSIQYLNFLLENIFSNLKALNRYSGSINTLSDYKPVSLVAEDVYNKDEFTFNNPEISLDNTNTNKNN